MKRRDLIRHLERCGCEMLREGGSHTVMLIASKEKRRQFRVIEKSMIF